MVTRHHTSGQPSTITVAYHDFAPVLEAGYASSLTEDGLETTHFAVIKTRAELDAAALFLRPFRSAWRASHPFLQPTITILAMRPERAASCERILESMTRNANGKSLTGFGFAYGEDIRFDDDVLYDRLAIPLSHRALGVFGVAYSQAKILHMVS